MDVPGSSLPQVRRGPLAWLTPPLRTAIEARVTTALGRPWRIAESWDYAELACHPCAVLRNPLDGVFVKYSRAPHARRQFEIEVEGLTVLSERAGVRVPRPVGLVSVADGALLLLDALDALDRGREQWRDIGRLLARLHRVRGPSFGYDHDGYWGPLPQDNTPAASWVTFFRERRLRPLLLLAIESGSLPVELIARIESVEARLPDLCGPEPEPTLLHGDAQGNNFVSTLDGAYAIDPAVYYGHPEMDLAAIDLWQPASAEMLAAYREDAPLAPDFAERRDLWRIPAFLGAVAVDGAAYVRPLTQAIRSYA